MMLTVDTVTTVRLLAKLLGTSEAEAIDWAIERALQQVRDWEAQAREHEEETRR